MGNTYLELLFLPTRKVPKVQRKSGEDGRVKELFLELSNFKESYWKLKSSLEAEILTLREENSKLQESNEILRRLEKIQPLTGILNQKRYQEDEEIQGHVRELILLHLENL